MLLEANLREKLRRFRGLEVQHLKTLRTSKKISKGMLMQVHLNLKLMKMMKTNLSHLIFPKKTKCISYVRQDQVYTHMIDVMSEISINSNKNVQELNHYIISLLHSDRRLEGLYNDQTITMKTQLHLHLPQAHDWGHASLRTPRSR
jgi:hypothetical protein